MLFLLFCSSVFSATNTGFPPIPGSAQGCPDGISITTGSPPLELASNVSSDGETPRSSALSATSSVQSSPAPKPEPRIPYPAAGGWFPLGFEVGPGVDNTAIKRLAPLAEALAKESNNLVDHLLAGLYNRKT